MGNAHRNRAKYRSQPCLASCPYCQFRPSEARKAGMNWKNKNGNRRNPTRKKRGRRHKKA